jgi:hypothetical protein
MSHIGFARLFVILAIAFTWVGAVAAQDQAAADARQFADAEWKLLDAGNYAKMYDATFDDSMKQTQTRDQWLAILDTIARQRGAMINRILANKTASMGIYRFVYSTQCSGGKVFEDIMVTKKDSGWKVVGIYVRPNLE